MLVSLQMLRGCWLQWRQQKLAARLEASAAPLQKG
jgi:hypothetical protein